MGYDRKEKLIFSAIFRKIREIEV